MYHIAMFSDGEIKSLATFNSYSEAEMEVDDFCEKHPNAWIEIVSNGDFEAAQR